MKRSRTFWAAAAFVCLAVMVFSGYSIYERLSLHMSGDTLEVHPVPLPPAPEDVTAAEGAKATEDANPAEEPKATPAPAKEKSAAPAEDGKIKAVKTLFEYKDAKYRSVKIAGSFTSWKDKPLTKKNGVWRVEIYILPGTYPYHFTVDGKKKLDPGKPKAPTGDSLVDVN